MSLRKNVSRALRRAGLLFIAKNIYASLGGIIYRPEVEWIDRLLGTRADVFFLQIGAHDGRTDDVIFPRATRLGWHGILLEPVPYLFQKLAHNYSGQNGILSINAALGMTDGSQTFYRLKQSDDPDLPKWYDQLGSFDKRIVLSHRDRIPNIRELLVEETVDCLTFKTLVLQYRVSKLDLILIDTEGYDFEILKTLDLKAFRPKLIVYERKHLSEADADKAERLLHKAGYRVHPSGANSVAVRLRG